MSVNRSAITIKVGHSGKANIGIRSFIDVGGLESVEITQGPERIIVPNTKLSRFAEAFRAMADDIGATDDDDL